MHTEEPAEPRAQERMKTGTMACHNNLVSAQTLMSHLATHGVYV